eukprot:TRINITY_DN51906_c0_g1_i1.p1 TRINITY_DN51906_c0_g1~~TRINITY_DN51906_c0_g1_i1.p1  ORF type:complete len:174 (-),score=6.35 TRINITY_DN51906_c0_g1_i1:108-629(-)
MSQQSKPSKNQLCKYFMRGNCVQGSGCRFVHFRDARTHLIDTSSSSQPFNGSADPLPRTLVANSLRPVISDHGADSVHLAARPDRGELDSARRWLDTSSQWTGEAVRPPVGNRCQAARDTHGDIGRSRLHANRDGNRRVWSMESFPEAWLRQRERDPTLPHMTELAEGWLFRL